MRNEKEETPAAEGVPGLFEEEANEETSSPSTPPDSSQKKVASIAPLKDVLEFGGVAAYAERIGATPGTLRSLNVIEFVYKYARVVARIKFGLNGVVTAPEGFQPTKEEQAAISAEWDERRFPVRRNALFTGRGSPPRDYAPWSNGAEGADYFIFWDHQRKNILMVEQHIRKDDGTKICLPWTYWSDCKWRMLAPDQYPVFGLERIGNAATIFIHEGAKAAHYITHNDLEGHPFRLELKGSIDGEVAHLGWIGGAPNVDLTDWRMLARLISGRRVIAVLDNDNVGKDALPEMSFSLGGALDAFTFSDDFDKGCDLADPFPPRLFKKILDEQIYCGPSFGDLIEPATWATIWRRDGEEGRPEARITSHFANDWCYITSLGVFVNLRHPDSFYNKEQFNQLVRHLSVAEDTARAMFRKNSVKVFGVTFAPGRPRGIINVSGKRMLNLWRPTQIRPQAGDVRPFLRYLFDLVPNRVERRALQKWIATLIAKPEMRMLYALLLISETQGVGKTTLCNILAALIGEHNTSFPSQSSVFGLYSGWIANKRLVVINELFDGGSGKANINSLKDKITDPHIEVNVKYQPQYQSPNWAHFILCSNEWLPVFLEKYDRRYFVPTLTEKVRARSYWRNLRDWLEGRGLSIIHQWAIDHVDKYGAVMEGDIAPSTNAKKRMIEESVSEGARLITDLAECLTDAAHGDDPQRIIMRVDEFKTYFNNELGESKARCGIRAIKKGLTDAGLTVLSGDERPKIGGLKVGVILNFTPKAGEKLVALIARHLKTPADVFGRERF